MNFMKKLFLQYEETALLQIGNGKTSTAMRPAPTETEH